MRNFFSKLKAFFLNHFYQQTFKVRVLLKARSEVINYDEFMEGLFKEKNPSKEYIISFKKDFKIACVQADLSAIAETCILNDYIRKDKNAIQKDSIVFDVGSHIGSFAVWAAKKGAKVYAFEPLYSNYERLLKNIQINGLENQIVPVNSGIYDTDTDTRMDITGTNTGGHLIDSTGQEKIKVEKLGTVCKRLGINSIDLMKIDVEGSEYTIFTSEDFINFNIKKIVGEYHLDWRKPEWSFAQIKKLLSPSYTTYWYHPYYFYSIKNKQS